jgi:indolepyruvate ferredoxin oxidoreductase
MNAPLPEAVRRALAEVTLDDKWTLDKGRVYLSGTQALIRLAMLQRQRDQLAGLNTAGFITGYRGSPLGGVDLTAWKAAKHLQRHQVRFQPGLNEDLAATSVWGTQQVNMYPGAKFDGVFAMWYGKGPGVDRCSDVFKHANAAGTSPHGGVLALAGDDHGAKSSTLPHQSDHIFKACMMPVLFPASVQEYLDLGLHGFAMSRYAGVWVGMKTVTEVVEASASVIVDPERVDIRIPTDFVLPPGGLNIRWPDSALEMEARLLDYKLYAALAYCRANRLNHTVIDSPNARFGIVASGKAYLDTRQALADLGLDEATCARVGIRLFKCGMVWPLEATAIRAFAEGLEEILVVEEKRQLIEYQLKEELFSWIGTGKRVPRVIGKFDEKDGGEWAVPQGNWILPAHYEFSPAIVAKAIAQRIGRLELPADVRAAMAARLAVIDAKEKALARPRVVAERTPWYCSGCPHNTSTVVPAGSRAMAGIGCHYMAIWMDRNTSTYTQMGGEGVPWIGQAPFTDEKHIFANLGDGTYFHSGSLAVRAAVAAGVSITYKILFNDAVAMTGGQPTDGRITVPMITQQMHAEGVRRIVIVTDEPDKYDLRRRVERDHSAVNAHGAAGDAWTLAPGVSVHHRDELDRIQRELREYRGVSVLIYDQTCASEKRRRRKQNRPDRTVFPDPPRRVVINELVCEGCGDCSVQSNCLSVEPLDTEFGRKRRINQSSCNKDYSCLKGFCPSFVTVEGGRLRKGAAAAGDVPRLPSPVLPALPAQRGYGVVITGVGGTGVVTIGQLLGMAAHLEGRGVSVLDMAGLAQKGGAVFSHVQIAPSPHDLFATRIAMGEADVLLGGDLIVSTSNEALSKIRSGHTRAVVNTAEAPTAEFVRNPDWQFGSPSLAQQLREAVGADPLLAFVDAQGLATALMGDAIYSNPFLLGFAWQKGWIPLSHEALTRAIELNGVAVEANRKAFEWGRCAAHDLDAVRRIAAPETASNVVELRRTASSLEETVARRADFLTGYQNAAYARRFTELVERVRRVESDRLQSSRLTEAVAASYFKLLAYKDEYEVARLHADPGFRARIAAQFEGPYRLNFHLAPPLLARPDPVTGRVKKIRFGPWMMTAFALLAKLKFLRGTALDPFGRTAERRVERALIGEFEQLVDEILGRLNADNHGVAIDLARLPLEIRGYGHVKAANLARVRPRRDELLARLRGQHAAQVIPIPVRAA